MTKRSPTASLKVLFIGNSFTARNDVPGLIAQLAAARGKRFDHQLISAGGASLASDARLAPYVLEDQLENLRKSMPKPQPLGPNESYAVAADTTRLLKNEGVPLLAGSDCPNIGTAHGVSLHRELELLVQAGLTPLEALRAATSAPTKAFRLKDRGSIKPGLCADLLLVQGDPTQNILATRDIVGVWKEGVAADREGWRMELQKERDKTKK